MNIGTSGRRIFIAIGVTRSIIDLPAIFDLEFLILFLETHFQTQRSSKQAFPVETPYRKLDTIAIISL